MPPAATKQELPGVTPPPRRGLRALPQRWRSSPPIGYSVAVVSVVAALALTWLTREGMNRAPTVLFFVAVCVTSWLGGLRPALLATGLSLVLIDYFFISQTSGLGLSSPMELVPLGAFAIGGAFVSWLAESQSRAGLEVAKQTRLLQEQNIELEQQMQESQALQEELEQTGKELATANDELLRNRDFLAQAQASAQLGSWHWDIKSDRVTWSDQMFRVYGLEAGSIEVAYENFSRFVHPDDRAMVHDRVTEALRSKQPFAYDHRVIWPDGTMRWVHGRGSVITDAQGEAVAMIGSGQDITERKRATDAQRLLADASEALASSLDYTQTLTTVAKLAVREIADWCSIAIGDETGRHSNLALAHRDPEKVKWAEEYNRLNPPRFDTPTGVPQVLRTGKSEYYPIISRELLMAAVRSPEELRVIEQLQMHSAMIVPMSARGRTIGAISFIGAETRRQFTEDDLWLAEHLANRAAVAIDNVRLFEEARAARDEAQTANAAKAQFLASMSHELRTPLNAIAGYAELIQMGVLGPVNEKQIDAIARLQRSSTHLRSLVDQVLSFARIEAGKVHFDLTHVPVSEALLRLAEMIAPQAEGKNVSYEFLECDGDVAVRADRDRFDQIILNLLSNAVKYTQSGGAVTVSVQCDAESVVIHVRDTGPGIPREKHQVIFQPFVQLVPNTHTTGVGLGLAISRDLARAMGGDISVESEPGHGSIFTLRLPRSANLALASGRVRAHPDR